MICPVCGKKFSFFKLGGEIYCSPECADKAEQELEDLLERMEKEETDEAESE